jgi:hypothetical protein
MARVSVTVGRGICSSFRPRLRFAAETVDERRLLALLFYFSSPRQVSLAFFISSAGML